MTGAELGQALPNGKKTPTPLVIRLKELFISRDHIAATASFDILMRREQLEQFCTPFPCTLLLQIEVIRRAHLLCEQYHNRPDDQGRQKSDDLRKTLPPSSCALCAAADLDSVHLGSAFCQTRTLATSIRAGKASASTP